MQEVPSDSELVALASSGDDDAFRELVSRYKNYVFAIIGRAVGDRELAEELSQDVFVKAYRGLPKFRGDAIFKTWLTRITLNTTHSYFRSKKFSNKKRTVSFEQEEILEPSASDHDPILKKQMMEAFRLCFGKMKSQLQEVITLCGYQEHTYEEAASSLEIPVGTVRSRLNRARLTLKECMDQKGEIRPANRNTRKEA